MALPGAGSVMARPVAKPGKPRSRTPRRDAANAVSGVKILELRARGMTLAQIGAELGITRQAVHQRVKKELAEAAADRKDLAEHQLEAELEAVDFVMRGLAPRVEKGDPQAATAYLRAMERRAKLLGLDAPTRTDITSGGEPLKVYLPDET